MKKGIEAQGIKASSQRQSAALGRLNSLSEEEATRLFHTVCGSKRWTARMVSARPFATDSELFAAAEREWFALDEADWLEAFSHHPRIGERNLSQQRFAATAAQSSREQSGMDAATDAQRDEFAKGNEEYQRRFGHVFLICATGKSAAEMLDALRARLGNTPEVELKGAAAEQAKIIRLRLEKWLGT
jgi:2-oxo-4-hydroxy-4-carboxy-5-ureidoimidazoline decarboxylase